MTFAKLRVALLMALGTAVGACNMVISESPMFTEADRVRLAPRDGIWIKDDEECGFEGAGPESEWPGCAIWIVFRGAGQEAEVRDGKKQGQHLLTTLVAGVPGILEAKWTDDAKDPPGTFYGYYAFEPGPAQADGRFVTASAWPVECGVQNAGSSDIRPFPGITAECRPSSTGAIRTAAASSRRAEQVEKWRWLRPEGQ